MHMLNCILGLVYFAKDIIIDESLFDTSFKKGYYYAYAELALIEYNLGKSIKSHEHIHMACVMGCIQSQQMYENRNWYVSYQHVRG